MSTFDKCNIELQLSSTYSSNWLLTVCLICRDKQDMNELFFPMTLSTVNKISPTVCFLWKSWPLLSAFELEHRKIVWVDFLKRCKKKVSCFNCKNNNQQFHACIAVSAYISWSTYCTKNISSIWWAISSSRTGSFRVQVLGNDYWVIWWSIRNMYLMSSFERVINTSIYTFFFS